MAAPAESAFRVRYLGFVYIDKPSQGVPDDAAIQKAATLLKSKKKEAQALHPLFARGFDTSLTLEATTQGLTVRVDEAGPDMAVGSVVMNHPIHKLAYVCDAGTCVILLVNRDSAGKFKCHSFEAGSAPKAREIAAGIAKACNEAFRRVRKSVRKISQRRQAAATAPTALTGVDESAQLKAVQELVQSDVSRARELLQETEGEDSSDRAGATSPVLATGSKIDFIEDLSDEFAVIVLGPTQNQGQAGASLDDDVFNCGHISGEVYV